MDLSKTGKLLSNLRKSKGMTQKQVADALGVVAKTVSKWETGHGFPDVSTLSALADVFGVSERMLLSGNFVQNKEEAGNMKRTKYYVCPSCGSFVQSVGECCITCCGRELKALTPEQADPAHAVSVSEVEDDFYVEIGHEMTKDHFIKFVSHVGFDRVLTVRMYPEQPCEVRLPRMYRGKLYYYCNQHGLFEYKL